MVLDPFSALSLTGNIVQFIDFAGKIVAKGNEIRANGAATGVLDLENKTTSLIEITTRLQHQVQPTTSSGCLTSDEQKLDQLAKNCAEVGNILLERLQRLKVVDGVKHRKWKSFRQALKTVWDKKNLDAFGTKLAEFRNQLELGILLSLKTDVNLNLLQQSDQYDQLSKQSQDLLRALAANQDVFAHQFDTQTATIATLHQNTILEIVQHQDSLPNRVADAVWKSILDNTHNRILDAHMEQVKLDHKMVDRAVLRLLTFPTMYDRYERIADAHEKTFEWIFRDPSEWGKPWSNFSKWLSQGDGVYWISGKAGSGKSTLMRYIVEHPRTKKLLAEWAGSERLTVANFFFWNGGTPDQSSQLGFLRALLHELLNKNRNEFPDLVRLVFPDEWTEAKDTMGSKWDPNGSCEGLSLRRLQKAFRTFRELNIGRMCIFIDGLDEYDGDFMETIGLFEESSSSNIKLCLSSRPWMVFEHAFVGKPKLRLQDLTIEDIERYVNDKLLAHSRMKALCKTEPVEAPKLVREIVTKASGVFLWVMLVVRDLLKGLTNHDKLPFLKLRVEALPSEIRELYSVMLGQIDPIYVQEGYRILQMMSISSNVVKEANLNGQRCVRESLCAIGLSFALEDNTPLPDMEFLTQEQVIDRVSEVDCRLKVCCSGLLEIASQNQAYFKYIEDPRSVLLQADGNANVQYLHRTVKDFIESSEMQEDLRKSIDSSVFNPYHSLLHSGVLRLRTCFSSRVGQMPVGTRRLGNIVEWCMMLARGDEMKNNHCSIELLDELETIASLIWDELIASSRYTTFASEILNEYSISIQGWRDDFLSLATCYHLSIYLNEKLGFKFSPENYPPSYEHCPQYFDYAIGSSPAACSIKIPNYRTIEVLCQYQAALHRRLLRISAWEKVLKKASSCWPYEDQIPQWASILELLITKGDGLVDPFERGQDGCQRVSETTRMGIQSTFLKQPEISTHLLNLLDAKKRENEEAYLAKMQAMTETIERLKAKGPERVPFYKLAVSRMTSLIALSWNQNMETVE